jgi:hypothetical protein
VKKCPTCTFKEKFDYNFTGGSKHVLPEGKNCQSAMSHWEDEEGCG